MDARTRFSPIPWDPREHLCQKLLRTRRLSKRTDSPLREQIQHLCEDVAIRGDLAVQEATRTFDRRNVQSIRVDSNELHDAARRCDDATRKALDTAIKRVSEYNNEIISRASWVSSSATGDMWGEIARPISSAGLFVPNGKGSFPSVAVQIGAPARSAKVPRLVMVIPPNASGPRLDSATAYVALRLSVDIVLCANGPALVAALTTGTESVPKVPMIVGPGSPAIVYAQEYAQTRGVVTVAGLGPTDSIIVADDGADPKLVAYDLVNEAEHGPDSSAILLASNDSIAVKVSQSLPSAISQLPEPRRSYAIQSIADNGGIFTFNSTEEAIDVANQLAGEHLQLAVADPQSYVDLVQNAGTLLLGQNTTFAASNYVGGTPATLPTTGASRMHSGVTAHTYMKTTSFLSMRAETMQQMHEPIRALAEYEGFPAHGNSSKVRLGEIV